MGTLEIQRLGGDAGDAGKPAAPLAEQDVGLTRFLVERFPESLLLLADMTPILAGFTSFWVAVEAADVRGAAAVFSGFDRLVVSIAANDAEAAAGLFGAIPFAEGPGATLVLSSAQTETLNPKVSKDSTDAWLVRRPGLEALSPHVVAITDPVELAPLYEEVGVNFWNPRMLEFGHYWGIREQGRVVAAAGVDFLIDSPSYGQIANVATLPSHRRRGLASACVRATQRSLATAGVGEVGLFVDDGSWLKEWYRGMGFVAAGSFDFFTIHADDPVFGPT
jgi:ribosomal protein S18 acetylase RimI-like enzyme